MKRIMRISDTEIQAAFLSFMEVLTNGTKNGVNQADLLAATAKEFGRPVKDFLPRGRIVLRRMVAQQLLCKEVFPKAEVPVIYHFTDRYENASEAPEIARTQTSKHGDTDALHAPRKGVYVARMHATAATAVSNRARKKTQARAQKEVKEVSEALEDIIRDGSFSLYAQDIRRSGFKVQKRDKEIEWFTELDLLYRKHIAHFRLSPIIHGLIAEGMRAVSYRPNAASSWVRENEDDEEPDADEKGLSWLYFWWRERNWRKIDCAILLLKDAVSNRASSVKQQEIVARVFKSLEPLHERSIAVRQEVVEHNLGLVMSIAMKMRALSVLVPDMIQEGNIGLMHAVEKFFLKKGWKFSTYAVGWIRSRIRRFLYGRHNAIRLPVHAAELLQQISKFEEKFETRYGRVPDVEEIARGLECAVDTVENILCVREKDVSLSQPMRGKDGDERRNVIDGIEAKNKTLDETMIERDRQIAVAEILLNFKPRERLIIELRYGLGNNEPHSLEEVGVLLPSYGYKVMSRERIRQIESFVWQRIRANARMREQLVPFSQ